MPSPTNSGTTTPANTSVCQFSAHDSVGHDTNVFSGAEELGSGSAGIPNHPLQGMLDAFGSESDLDTTLASDSSSSTSDADSDNNVLPSTFNSVTPSNLSSLYGIASLFSQRLPQRRCDSTSRSLLSHR